MSLPPSQGAAGAAPSTTFSRREDPFPAVIYTDRKYNASTPTVLTDSQRRTWTHKQAATSASRMMYPCHVGRKLGSITRVLTETSELGQQRFPQGPRSPYFADSYKRTRKYAEESKQKTVPASFKKVTPSVAKREALQEVERGTLTEFQVPKEIPKITKAWHDMLNKVEGTPKKPTGGWDTDGCLPMEHLASVGNYTPLSMLYRWVHHSATQLLDSHSHATAELYDGKVSIPTDTQSILGHLRTLCTPVKELWDSPLLICVPRVKVVVKKKEETRTKDDEDDRPSPSKKPKLLSSSEAHYQSYKIEFGIYAHRLLFESMTIDALQCVIASLDPGSYTTSIPLVLPPSPSTGAVFESSPYPKVVLEDEPDKNEDGVIDLTLEGVSMEQDDTISAFTTKGLLKLLESTGSDITHYQQHTHAFLQDKLQVDLLLHQQHGIAWMLQMETLQGPFGINSILWEERQFPDGGNYYWAPSIGQLRLDRPPCMYGGLLCDEMGLGKTIEVLGLIVATLQELKEAASPADDSYHTTLIVVPPALLVQWQSEIRKVTGDLLIVDVLDSVRDHPRFERILGPVTNGADVQQMKMLTQRRGVKEEPLKRFEPTPDIVLTTYRALDQTKTLSLLKYQKWGRIVLDEMQEIRSSTTKTAKSCESLYSDRRWMLSGTPLYDGIGDFRGELNFLRLAPFSAGSEDGFFNFCITNPWEAKNPRAIEILQVLSQIMLRRAKSMTIKATGAPLLGLKPLTVEFVSITQSVPERALYYFLEWIVAQELRSDKEKNEDTNTLQQNKVLKHHQVCLRLLREMCVTAILINGGLGVPSQLKDLNKLLLQQMQRARANDRIQSRQYHAFDDSDYENDENVEPSYSRNAGPMSCDQAILHLAQIQESVRTGDDSMISTMQLGMGQGLARRARAGESIDSQIQVATETIKEQTKKLKKAKASWAKLLWHRALEKITCGALPDEDYENCSDSFRTLWAWRGLFQIAKEGYLCQERNLPKILARGWRPSKTFVEELPKKHPDFFWAKPHTSLLESIPKEVKLVDIEKTVANALENCTKSSASSRYELRPLNASTAGESWSAALHIFTKQDNETFRNKTHSSAGIPVATKATLPNVSSELKIAKEQLADATAALNVHPTDENHKAVSVAKKKKKRLEQGLHMVRANSDGAPYNICVSTLTVPARSPREKASIYRSSQTMIDEHKGNLTIAKTVIAQQETRIQRLRHVASKGISEKVQGMSAFDSLQALTDGRDEDTQCAVCLDHLGFNERKTVGGKEIGGIIAMTKCGHLYCKGCLQEALNYDNRGACPSCRREIRFATDIYYVDPSLKQDISKKQKQQKQAKDIVQAASRMLEESNGQLEPEMWEQLYRSMEIPAGVNRSLDSRISVVPRDFLAHLRQCTGLPVMASASEAPYNLSVHSPCLSSKVKALVHDLKALPANERSVVFSTSKLTINHLSVVLTKLGFGNRVLCTGLKVGDIESACAEWRSNDPLDSSKVPYPVLLVQAGYAASGLTLTDACKIFMMEPFLKAEEEAQAYARCHRYGQTKPVHCKVYYAPVSVESRLLEWRRKVANHSNHHGPDGAPLPPRAGNQDPQLVYTSAVYSDDDEDDDDDESEGKVKADSSDDDNLDQTKFLLGIEDDGRANHGDKKPAARPSFR